MTTSKAAWVGVVVHTGLLIGAGFAHWCGYYRPARPYDDVCINYLFVSGPVVWLCALVFTSMALTSLSTQLMYIPSPVQAVIIVPGIVCAILGGIQWYLVVSQLVHRTMRRQQKGFEVVCGIERTKNSDRSLDVRKSG